MMIKDNIIEGYCLGGATALSYYSTPVMTEDIDIFITLKSSSLIVDLTPVSEYIKKKEKDVKVEGQYIIISGLVVQFILPYDKLSQEGYDSRIKTSEGFYIYELEYLMAMMIELSKPKYRYRLSMLDDYDTNKLNKILKKHNLLDKWKKIKDEF